MIQLIVNNEDFLTSRHLRRMIQTLVDPGTRDFNFDQLEAKDLSLDQFIAIMQTVPMMSDSRLVIIRGFESYLKSGEKKSKGGDLDKLTRYFADPNPTTHVIMVSDKLDKRTTFYKGITKSVEILEMNPLYPTKTPPFITTEAKNMGLELEPGCAEVMAEMIGTNLMAIVSELEKLQLYVHPEKRVTRQQIGALVTEGLVENVFAIAGLIGQKKYAEVYGLYSRMREQGEPVIKLTFLIINHFKKLQKAKSILGETRVADQNLVAAKLGVPRFFVGEYIGQAKGFSEEALRGIYRRLMRLSEGIRASGPEPETLFASFLQEVCV